VPANAGRVNAIFRASWYADTLVLVCPLAAKSTFRLYKQLKNAYSFQMVYARHEMYTKNYREAEVALSIGDVISGLFCPLSAKSDKSPSLTNEKRP
jgi:hypothetical protein